MRRSIALIPVAALIVLIALFAGFSLRRNPKVIPMALVGKPAPPLVLPRLADGAAQPLRPLIRGPALVNFYASWCVPCEQEAPALMALKAEGVRIIGIAYENKPQEAKGFLARFGDPFEETLVDLDGRGGVEFGVTGVPETYAVDAAGVIRDKRAAPITPADAEAMLQRAGR
jgi:cytochrome c biogenesis protein CcmG/thiol:disulfide interchange protein DsbE